MGVFQSLKNISILNAKNIIGWRSNRKIVVISVDDYGNVRVDSKKARNEMDKKGLEIKTRFDAYDALETYDDLEALYEVLTSVTDARGRYPVFSSFAVPCNINFERIAETGYQNYYYELLPKTFEKLSGIHPTAYMGTWNLLKEGIERKLLAPHFHGREHLNIKIFKEKLDSKDRELLTAIHNRSYTSISSNKYPTISPTAAFDFWELTENKNFDEVIADGLEAFKKVYGYKADHFNPPGGREHPAIHNSLQKHGIKYIDTPMLKREHQGQGKYKRVFNYTGKKNELGQTFIVRNVVFEPTDGRGVDWVEYTLKQIEAAFRWNRPAIISSHRVNFCGHIDEKNREKGLDALQKLLHEIVNRWPDVEFMAANELGELISEG